MLYSLPTFIQHLNPFRDRKEGEVQPHPLVSAFLLTYRQLHNQTITAVRPYALKQAVDAKTDKFEGTLQRDAHEFLGDLIDRMHEEIESGKGEQVEPVDEFFRLNVEVCLQCKSCGYSRYVLDRTR